MTEINLLAMIIDEFLYNTLLIKAIHDELIHETITLHIHN